MAYYVGILDGSGKVWGVRFPDLPGCVGAGASPEEAIADATTALRDAMTYKRSGRHQLPKASTSPRFSSPAKSAAARPPF